MAGDDDSGIDNGRLNGGEANHDIPSQELTFAFGA
jgi:hypothetical protein